MPATGVCACRLDLTPIVDVHFAHSWVSSIGVGVTAVSQRGFLRHIFELATT